MKKIILLVVNFIFILGKSQIGINTPNPQEIFHVDGSGDNEEVGISSPEQYANDFVITSNGSVGIGVVKPDASAILDVNVDGLESGHKKGFLGPKAELSSRTDQITIPSPATGLLVYNLGTGGLKYNGYVFWNGTEWRSLNNDSLIPGAVESIVCNGVTLYPGTYTAGVSYTGTMNVPYTGGNGGIYPAQSIGPVNGLTATLSAGSFNSGSGSLSYTITGVPTVSSPITTTFLLNIGGQSCSAVVGMGNDITPGNTIYYKTSLPSTPAKVWLSAYAQDLPILGGKLRLDAYFSHDSSQSKGHITMYPRLVNISSSPVKIWFSVITNVHNYTAGNYLLAPSMSSGVGTSLTPSAYVDLDDGIYLNLGFDDRLGESSPRTDGAATHSNQEVLAMDISMDDKWYRVYYFPFVDNKNTSSTSDDTREIFLSIQRLY